MTFRDALFNWLQIKIVAEGRPNDKSAQETFRFFTSILKEEHHLDHFYVEADGEMYIIHYVLKGEKKIQKYIKGFADKLLLDIESNPKYNE